LLALGAALLWAALGGLALARPHRLALARAVYLPGAAAGLLLAVASVHAVLASSPTATVRLLGPAGLVFTFRAGPLAAVFLALLGTAAFAVSVFARGYFRPGEGTPPGALTFAYELFLAALAGVVLAGDALTFMAFWELMTLASYALVLSEQGREDIRRAARLYLVMAQASALLLLVAFAILSHGGTILGFAAMRAALPTGEAAALAFLAALAGFGAKAGLVPTHVWLPEAHPAAPSPVSALMSGVMLEVAVYGLVRVTGILRPELAPWWGVLLVVLGSVSGLYGALFAAVQTDVKRLLAYSSIENIGLILTAFGLALLFATVHQETLAVLAFAASLYLCLNHTAGKSLLFLAAGSVLHATGERNLGRLGGLLERMPWVGATALLGAAALAGLPPLGGFAAEWLLLQTWLRTPRVFPTPLDLLLPLAAAVFVLTAALAAYVMLKFYAVAFLGRPREERLVRAHDAGADERTGLAALAAAALLLGILPGAVAGFLAVPAARLFGSPAAAGGASPTAVTFAASGATYAPAPLLLATTVLLAFLVPLVRRARTAVLRAPLWACGGEPPGPRAQDTSEGFGQPIRRVFAPFFAVERRLPEPDDRHPSYRVSVADRLALLLYAPLPDLVERLSRLATRLQQGRLAVYLALTFATLVLVLFGIHAA